LTGVEVNVNIDAVRKLFKSVKDADVIAYVALNPRLVPARTLLYLERVAEVVFSLSLERAQDVVRRFIFLKRFKRLPKPDIVLSYSMTVAGPVVEAVRRV